jgi:hypothetical protein
MGDVRINWSRAELRAVREAVEVTPHFEGRPVVRDTLRRAVRGRSGHVSFELDAAERFGARLVALDLPTALAKVKLLRAIREVHDHRSGATTSDIEAA